MFIARIFRLRSAAPLALIALLGFAGFGFAAGNTVNATRAGDANAGISGYSTSNVEYTTTSTTPAYITNVKLSVTPTSGEGNPRIVKVALKSVAGSKLYPCTKDADPATVWNCSVTSGEVAAVDADRLTVVATE
jgi:hypothetical protein